MVEPRFVCSHLSRDWYWGLSFMALNPVWIAARRPTTGTRFVRHGTEPRLDRALVDLMIDMLNHHRLDLCFCMTDLHDGSGLPPETFTDRFLEKH